METEVNVINRAVFSQSEPLEAFKQHDKAPLIGETQKISETKVYWYRWYICFVFAFFGMLQGVVWNTWSPINESAEAVFGFTTSDINLLANWGPISFMIFMPVYSWLFEYSGLRLSVLSSAMCTFLGCGLRCIPGDYSLRRILAHIGQFLNGIAGCTVMAAPSFISNVWFRPQERVTATSIMGLFNYFGTGVAYAVGFLVDPPNSTDNNSSVPLSDIRTEINNVLYVEFACAAILFISMLIFFPNKPKIPPSVSASVERMSFKKGLLSLLRNKNYWVIMVTSAALLGSWGGWTGVMSVILEYVGVSQEKSDFVGFVTTSIGCIVAMTVGWLTDRLKGKMKLVYVVLLSLSLIAFAYFVIIYGGWIKVDFFQLHDVQLWCVMVMLGITLNALVPLGMELSCDAAYPVSEGTSGSVLVWGNNVFSFVFVLILNSTPNPIFANYVMLAFFVLSVPIVVFGLSSKTQRLQLDLHNESES